MGLSCGGLLSGGSGGRGEMFRDLSGRQLVLELNGKVCSSETSDSEF